MLPSMKDYSETCPEAFFLSIQNFEKKFSKIKNFGNCLGGFTKVSSKFRDNPSLRDHKVCI